MDPEIQAMLEERFAELPQQLRDFIQRPATKAAIRVIGEKHHLTEDKFITFENEVMLVLLGFERREGFDERVMAELLIPGSVAASIARDVEEMIFSGVREELTRIAQEQDRLEDTAMQESPSEVQMPMPTARTVPPAPVAAPQTQPPRPVADVPRYVKDDPYREPPK